MTASSKDVFLLAILSACLLASLASPDENKRTRRTWYDDLDTEFNNSVFYKEFAKPILRAGVHVGRYLITGNEEEWIRAKDQLGKTGTGRSKTVK